MGVVAVLDALGSKGLWESWPAQRIVRKYRRLMDALDSWTGLTMQRPKRRTGLYCGSMRCGLVFFSDTVVIASWMAFNGDAATIDNEISSFQSGGAINDLIRVAHLAAELQWRAASPQPTLLYRGAIAVGELYIEDNVFVGPAIDTAAEHATIADGAFVLVAPSTLASFAGRSFADYYRADSLLPSFAVPLRTGGTVESWVVNPFPAEYTATERRRRYHVMLSGFDRKARSSAAEAIIRKRANTNDFWEMALKASAKDGFYGSRQRQRSSGRTETARSLDL